MLNPSFGGDLFGVVHFLRHLRIAAKALTTEVFETRSLYADDFVGAKRKFVDLIIEPNNDCAFMPLWINESKAKTSMAPKKRASDVVSKSKAKTVRFADSSVDKLPRPTAGRVPRGVVTAKSVKHQQRKKEALKRPREPSSSSEDDSVERSDEENLDALASASSDDEQDTKKRRTDATEKLCYPVLQLRHLPPEFQEPELKLFFNQFGSRVVNCFCARSRRSHQSKGIAYVQFADPEVISTAIDECDGMLLGNRTVRAKKINLHRPMPSKQKIQQRYMRAFHIMSEGKRMQQFQQQKRESKDIVGKLIKYARNEKKTNSQLKKMGIAYEYRGFEEQLRRIPCELFSRGRNSSTPHLNDTSESRPSDPTEAAERATAVSSVTGRAKSCRKAR
jgi:RNA recognition motif-containing protein